ncbi:hypothetical protein QR680_015903 [Steinernema hermaphroditum]|uniref:7TM GPCR serpentine receptor class x (Srx) domain-containing protein n=1 Tax=Steinernema hermaphroditum TaxID=289476 RepID=A0AA39LLP3_9BILA|nr:hypothetical protein QR680_015903 [Steinernema hermaphroditum]
MEQLNVTEVFYYGNELQGRGETSAFDIAVGVFVTMTVVQNISMYGTLVAVVMVNNRASSGQAYSIIAFNALIASHLNNGLALIIFNPEVHKFLGIRKNIKIDPTSSERLAATSAKNAAPAS